MTGPAPSDTVTYSAGRLADDIRRHDPGRDERALVQFQRGAGAALRSGSPHDEAGHGHHEPVRVRQRKADDPELAASVTARALDRRRAAGLEYSRTYCLGTAAVNNGSASVTLSVSQPASLLNQYCYFRGDTSGGLYQITSNSSGTARRSRRYSVARTFRPRSAWRPPGLRLSTGGRRHDGHAGDGRRRRQFLGRDHGRQRAVRRHGLHPPTYGL